MTEHLPLLDRDDWHACKAATDACAPKVLPANWREIIIPPSHPAYGPRCYQSNSGLQVLLSVGPWEDGKNWLHVSVTAPRRVPYYAELCDVKEIFVGRERQALQVFSRRSEHVNIHPYCLHLWACLEDDGLPRFGRHGSI